MSQPAILLLAAGASRRMAGRDKLIEAVEGRPLIRDRAEAALATALPVIVALPPQSAAPDRWEALAGLDLVRCAVVNPADGMSASLAHGLRALPPDATGVMVLLADMPEITSDDMLALLSAFDGDHIQRGAGADGMPGHPVLFPRRDFAALSRLTGDSGARSVLAREAARVRLVPLPKAHALTDLDTAADWARWRGGQQPG